MTRLEVGPETRRKQYASSDPAASAWVSAHAGSGKTHVLAQRVIRLLLADTDPSCILALTFTKAAAANMATKVFSTLAGWVTLDDAALADAITAVDERAPDARRLELARRLFARAVETPGGLKIQTIHAFCERILHLFPFEANVPARFSVLDDTAAEELLARAQAETVVAAATASKGSEALERVIATVGEDGFAALMKEAVGIRHVLRDLGDADRIASLVRAGLAIGQDRTADVEQEIVQGGISPAEWPRLIAALRHTNTAKSRTMADDLAAALGGAIAVQASAYRGILLTGKDQPFKDGYLVKAFRTDHPDLASRLDADRERVATLVDRLKRIETAERTHALAVLAEAVIGRYEAEKARRGLLDFDDLIAATDTMLASGTAAWVLYRLDQGIDHILVDEAQDTSAAQWRILDHLLQEFTAGAGAAKRRRTIFVVGDPKQSIYSFQGASPAAFDAQQRAIARRYQVLAGEDPRRWRFEANTLTLSFRSTPEVLAAVDAVFETADARKGVGEGVVHQSARTNAPGLVEIWPPETPGPAADEDAWAQPLDQSDASSPAVRLATRIARMVARWRRDGDAQGHRIRAGDVLILVRSRNAVFSAVIRALKDAGVPVAGADRLVLTSHIAVLDLLALGRTCLLPDDDLTLATVLRSPLCGLDEDALFGLAADRPGSLHAALEVATGEVEQVARNRLAGWRALAARCGPFDFYARVLGPDGGRRAMLGRLGPEAGDAMDEFLRLALDHERTGLPGLAGFLAVLDGAELTVKRDLETSRDEVRVMTVHGAKGLEAPVVILADTCASPNARHDPCLLMMDVAEGGRRLTVPVWAPRKDDDPQPVAALRQAHRDAAQEEYNRLLYVAMTRARDRLYVAGFHGTREPAATSWYAMIRAALAPSLVEEPADDGVGAVLRRRSGVAKADAVNEPPAPPEVALPAWLTTPAPPEPPRRPPLRPSGAATAADAAPEGRGEAGAPAARRIGVLVHGLLEVLPDCPPERRGVAAAAWLKARGGDLAQAERERITTDVLALMEDPQLAALFGPGSRAEAAVAGTLPLGPNGMPAAVSGQIDRLAVTPEAVLVADYKTSAWPPPAVVPAAYVVQLALYRALVGPLYPDRPVRCLLVWTAGPSVVEITPEALDAAVRDQARVTAP